MPARPSSESTVGSAIALALTALVGLTLVASCSVRRDEPGTAAPGSTTAAPLGTGPTPSVAPAVEATGSVRHGELLTPDTLTRTYRLYIPDSLGDEPAPLLIALHGGIGWADQFAETDQVEGLAEANGFVVVHPDGVPLRPRRPSATWNGGYCCGPSAEEDVDDVGFIEQLLDLVESELPIDPDRVYAMGHSNGGIMSYRLACELGDRIVGIGVVGASLGVDECAPDEPVSVIHIHGEADANHPIDGGTGERSIAGVSFHPAIDGVTTLARVDGCSSEPTTTSDGDLTTDVWEPCDGGTAVAFVRIAGAGHAWPGSTGGAVTGAAYQGYDATAAIWTFLAAHPRP